MVTKKVSRVGEGLNHTHCNTGKMKSKSHCTNEFLCFCLILINLSATVSPFSQRIPEKSLSEQSQVKLP